VKWDNICKPKKEAGLGIRDLRLVNISLLSKWRWKLLSHDNELWKDVIAAKYGRECVGVGSLGSLQVSRVASKWWRDICSLDKNSNWFADAVEKTVGDGKGTLFWSEIWVANQPLQERFPRIFGISNQKSSTIFTMGGWVDEVWEWNFSWRRNLFVWEIPIFEEFCAVVNHFRQTAQEDKWVWRANIDDGFLVGACYSLLYGLFREPRVLEGGEEYVFVKL
jgi:hypothetical protein